MAALAAFCRRWAVACLLACAALAGAVPAAAQVDTIDSNAGIDADLAPLPSHSPPPAGEPAPAIDPAPVYAGHGGDLGQSVHRRGPGTSDAPPLPRRRATPVRKTI